MTASTTITCTKSDFSQVLAIEFVDATSEMTEVMDGLVRQANAHRGTFTGHSAYLDCDFTVTPDEDAPRFSYGQRVMLDGRVMVVCSVPPGNGKPDTYGVQPPTCSCKRPFGTTWVGAEEIEPLTIPAVTGIQRDQAHRAAYDSAHNVGTELLSDVMVMALSPDRLDQLASALSAAAGHLRIAEQR